MIYQDFLGHDLLDVLNLVLCPWMVGCATFEGCQASRTTAAVALVALGPGRRLRRVPDESNNFNIYLYGKLVQNLDFVRFCLSEIKSRFLRSWFIDLGIAVQIRYIWFLEN